MNDLLRERNKLIQKSAELNGLCFDDRDRSKSYKMKQLQNELYKKYKFYDSYIKAERKVRNGKRNK